MKITSDEQYVIQYLEYLKVSVSILFLDFSKIASSYLTRGNMFLCLKKNKIKDIMSLSDSLMRPILAVNFWELQWSWSIVNHELFRRRHLPSTLMPPMFSFVRFCLTDPCFQMDDIKLNFHYR